VTVTNAADSARVIEAARQALPPAPAAAP
jgi:hypothetical protein